jgi:hypothetical protein
MDTMSHLRFRIPVLLFPVLLAAGACGYRPPEITGMSPDSAFTEVVVPILRDQCEGCHFEGGAMFQAMPFDDLDLVTEHGDELMVQLKGTGRERMQEWLARVRAAAPPDTAGQP